MNNKIISFLVLLSLFCGQLLFSQSNFTPAVKANFGVKSNMLSGLDSSGTDDWAQGSTGRGVLFNSGLPDYANFENTAHVKDRVGGRGESSVFTSTAKSGDNMKLWTLGAGSPTGKTDIINAYAHARRDNNDSLWFFVAAERMVVSGATTVDFEFLKKGVTINSNGTLTPLGADSGRTAGIVTTPVVNGGATISKPGDFLIVTEYGGSSVSTDLYMWTKNPPTGTTFDQGSGVSPYGWAKINPPAGSIFAAQNTSTVTCGPWGTFQGSSGDSTNTLSAKSFVEVALNMTKLGIDDTSTCANIGQAFVHSRTSPSFSSNLSDFAGPLSFQLNTCATIGVNSLQDTDGLLSTAGDETAKNWNLLLYKNSVAPVNLVASVASGSTLGTLDTLRRGTYIAVEADSASWSHLGVLEVSDQNGSVQHPGSFNSYSFYAGSGDTIALSFVNAKNASLSGQVYRDVNSNGIKDSGEPGLSGWTVQALNTSNVVQFSTTTDVSGNYTFSGIIPGVTYRIREVVQATWTQTSANPSDTVLVSNASLTGINFGNGRLTTVTLSSSPTPSQRHEGVILTATLSQSTATGSVEFFDGTTSLGTATVTGGVAILLTSSISGGDRPITAVYTGDATYNGSTSSIYTHVVLRASTSVVLGSSPNPSTYGQSVVVTATMNPLSASGTVEFFDGAVSLGTSSLNSGVATISTSSFHAGSHSLKARYQGDADYDTSSSPVRNHVVNQVGTITTVSAPTIQYNADGSATVSVSSTVGTPSGNVTLSVDGGTGIVQPLSGGTSNFTLSGLTAGTHSLSATYDAQGDYAASSGTGSIVVDRAATTTAITAPTITYNADGSITVGVSSSAGTVTGSVGLSVDGGVALMQELTGGSTIFTVASPSAGNHTLLASFAAQGNFDSSSTTGTLQVNKATTSISVSAPTITYNSNGFVTVTVTSASGIPSGNVTLSVDGGVGSTQALTNGSVQFTVTTPAAGDHSLQVEYLAQGNFDSSSNSGTLHVNKAPTSISIVAPTITYGGTASISVTVTSESGTPSGTVSLSVDGGAALTQSLSGGSATFSIPGLTGGNHALSGTYSAQGNFDASNGTGSIHVDRAGSTTALVSSLNPSILSQTVTFTATMIPTVATGTVEFFDGSTSLGVSSVANDTATLSISSLQAGMHTLTAVYSGDNNLLGSTSSAVDQSVLNPVPVTTSITPSFKTLGGPTFTLDVYGMNFLPISVVRFDGNARSTTYINGTHVQATILAGDLLSLGNYSITVFNPTPGGGESNVQEFTVVGASISGTSYNDLNGNGVKDAGEPGLANWSLALSGVKTDTVQTDADGKYIFTLNSGGTYYVREVVKSSWIQTSVQPDSISVTLGEDVPNINFGNFKSPLISGYVYEDLNGNGMFDGGEPPLSGRNVTASKGLATKSMSSGVDGGYTFSFDRTETGEWFVADQVVSGWYHSIPLNGTHSIFVQSALDTQNVNFGNYRLGSISGKKYEDIAGDSTLSGDPTLSGWVVKLYKNNQFYSSRITSGDGSFLFDSLAPAIYVLQESLATGWAETYPTAAISISPINEGAAGPRAYGIDLQSNSTITGKHFGNFKLGSISGTRYHDIDGDSIKDAGEQGLPSLKIYLSHNAVVDSAMTDGSGNYSFTELFAGSYQVSEDIPAGWYQTQPGSGSYTETISSGDSVTGRDFGNFEYGTVTGWVWFDRDSSGTKDPTCETILPGQKIVLVGTHTLPDTVVSDENGVFTFYNVAADAFTLTQGENPGWNQTYPAHGLPYTLTMTSGLDTAGFAFGKFFMADTMKFRTFILSDYNKASRALKKSGYISNPSAGNVRDNVFLQRGFGLDNPNDSGYLRIGIRRPDSSLIYGWFFHHWTVYKKAAVSKWIYNTAAWGLKRDPKTKTKVLRTPPNYLGVVGEVVTETYFGNAGNHLTMELTTLKTNIAASDLEITPKGLGDLLYVCRDFTADSVFNGKSLRTIVAIADTMLTMGRKVVHVNSSQIDTTYRCNIAFLYLLDSTLARINNEFRSSASKLDTISTKPLKLKGVKGLYKVSYLQRDSIAPIPLAHFEADYTEVENTPLVFRLDQNYPNPFNPTTMLSFELATTSNVSITIYNVLGQAVTTLVDNRNMEEGVHEVLFDATNFASGVYFYKLEAKGIDEDGMKHTFNDMKKMILIK